MPPTPCRAVIWQMLLVSVAITYCCTGVAYVLSQVGRPRVPAAGGAPPPLLARPPCSPAVLLGKLGGALATPAPLLPRRRV